MTLRIAQDYAYGGSDWWQWRIWLEGPDEELDRVESVTYKLHETFRQPIRTVRDRSTKFELREGGWGTFTIYVSIDRKDRTSESLEHELVLSDTDAVLEEVPIDRPRRSTDEAPSERPSVFLSYEAEDAASASKLRAELESMEIDVVCADSLDANLPPDVAVERALETSDALVMLSGSTGNEPGFFVHQEARAAKRANKPVVVVGSHAPRFTFAVEPLVIAKSDAALELPLLLRNTKRLV